jgi:protein-S-isoprenylcysteine O-methyltransferase Ste14
LGQINWTRVGVKLIGLWGTLGLIVAAYWLFPEYHREFYAPFWIACATYLPHFAALSLIYFVLVDSWMNEPFDEYLNAGQFFLWRTELVETELLRQHALNWIIKGFFLPLMFIYLGNAVTYLIETPFAVAFDSFPRFVGYVSRLALGIDLAFVAIGYVLTLRLTDSHIRNPNQLLWGWVLTVIMYYPFFSIIGRRYLDYKDDANWLDMLGADWGAWVFVWGTAIIITKIGWAWSNMSFGLRFSNLTHRGIITNGPYRWTRHPSYIFKNISWWLLSVPFFSLEGPETALRHSLLLLMINLVYFLRAKAEEAHLSDDPTYVEYAMWIEEHGKLRWLRSILPFVRYAHAPAPKPQHAPHGATAQN